MAQQGVNIANGLFSLFTLFGGVALSALLAIMLKKSIEDITGGGSAFIDYGSLPVWAIGFAFIVPGLLGVIASASRNKCLYITQMVFSILTLIIMGIFFALGILALAALPLVDTSDCHDVQGVCTCADISIGYSCSVIMSMYQMAISIVAMIIGSWILTLVATILGGVLACQRQDVYLYGGTVSMSQVSQGPGVPNYGYSNPSGKY